MARQHATAHKQSITQRACRYIAIGFLCVFIANCGHKKQESPPSAPPLSPSEVVFQAQSRFNQLPYRMVMAMAYLESRIQPTSSSAIYKGLTLSPAIAETAFGISKEELSIAAGASTDDLKSQIVAYTAWVGRQLKSFKMPIQPQTTIDKFNWLLRFADLHRGIYDKDVRAIFLKEAISLLNNGFIWQDPVNRKILTFAKENPPIDIDAISAPYNAELNINDSLGDSPLAEMIYHIRPNNPEQENTPIGILVNHCPFSLSTCLKLQLIENDGRGFFAGTHYLIPQDDSIFTKPIQISRLKNPVPILNSNGERILSDRIIITLVGHSGRITSGLRTIANPIWLSKKQLLQLGSLTEDICKIISGLHQEPTAFYNQCLSIEEGGIEFQISQDQTNMRFDDIADFDPFIFNSHIKAIQGLVGDAAFDTKQMKTSYRAGESIPLTLNFQNNAKTITLERLIRCPNQTTKWHPIVSDKQIRNKTQNRFEVELWDKGPNSDGQQFFRAKVFGSTQPNSQSLELLGWATAKVYVEGYDQAEEPYSVEACFN